MTRGMMGRVQQGMTSCKRQAGGREAAPSDCHAWTPKIWPVAEPRFPLTSRLDLLDKHLDPCNASTDPKLSTAAGWNQGTWERQSVSLIQCLSMIK